MTDLGKIVTVNFWTKAQFELKREDLFFWIDNKWQNDEDIRMEDRAFMKRTKGIDGELPHDGSD